MITKEAIAQALSRGHTIDIDGRNYISGMPRRERRPLIEVTLDSLN